MTATDQSQRHGLVRLLPSYEPDGPPPPELTLDLELPVQPAGAGAPLPLPASRTLADAAARVGAHIVLRLLLEVLDGRRPVAHLAAAVSGPVLRYVTAARGVIERGRPAQRTGPAARLRSLRLSQPGDEVAEVSAVYQLRGRIRAVAARLELDEDSPLGWRCTALRLG